MKDKKKYIGVSTDRVLIKFPLGTSILGQGKHTSLKLDLDTGGILKIRQMINLGGRNLLARSSP